ncbi:hypothetical protein BZG36_04502 [Bifiguratus adelaidae]|uniref:DUF962-domain-containing protein n=1 Tax=Bifiguratus adelaidae TaxID=1938954 RepID=A0A261XW14_9FUNG|nr:hypothetical protein BZG36_04502 [Bifiguratus adelaidae]
MSGLFDLKHQLFVYGAHHHNKVNVFIHIVCIPLILWTSLVFSATTGPLVKTSLSLVEPNLAFFGMVVYAAYYLALDPVAGLIATPILFYCVRTATNFLHTQHHAVTIALAIHVFSWIAQFVGHGVYEKRKPKLLDNLVQALILAPYFVLFEILFFLGYRPKLHAEWQADVEKDVRAFWAKKKQA